MKQEGFRRFRSMFPLARVQFFGYRFFEPQLSFGPFGEISERRGAARDGPVPQRLAGGGGAAGAERLGGLLRMRSLVPRADLGVFQNGCGGQSRFGIPFWGG